MVREKVIQQTRQELPYVTAVLIEEFAESETITRIHADIVVEKESQKPIVIGRGEQESSRSASRLGANLKDFFRPRSSSISASESSRAGVTMPPWWQTLDYRGEG